jgi:hypothetical protein
MMTTRTSAIRETLATTRLKTDDGMISDWFSPPMSVELVSHYANLRWMKTSQRPTKKPRCNDEDTMIWLKYYADEEERQRWNLDFPDHPLPAHEPLSFDRDRHLPKRPAF